MKITEGMKDVITRCVKNHYRELGFDIHNNTEISNKIKDNVDQILLNLELCEVHIGPTEDEEEQKHIFSKVCEAIDSVLGGNKFTTLRRKSEFKKIITSKVYDYVNALYEETCNENREIKAAFEKELREMSKQLISNNFNYSTFRILFSFQATEKNKINFIRVYPDTEKISESLLSKINIMEDEKNIDLDSLIINEIIEHYKNNFENISEFITKYKKEKEKYYYGNNKAH